MSFRVCRVEFIVAGLEDIRFLYRTWDDLLSMEGLRYSEVSLVNVAVDDRLPSEAVSLNFTGAPALMDKFLSLLEQAGLKFARQELIPGLITICRFDHDRGGLEAIDVKGGHDPGGRRDS